MKVERGIEKLWTILSGILGLILLGKIISWLQDGVWPTTPISEGLRISPPETTWVGINKIATYVLESDMFWFYFAIWGLVSLIYPLVEGTDQYDDKPTS